MNPLDMRDIAIIDSLPVYNWDKKIFTVGCGKGRLEWCYLIVVDGRKRNV